MKSAWKIGILSGIFSLGMNGAFAAALYYHPDHLGSATVMTNEHSEIAEAILYAPFGEVLHKSVPEETASVPFLYTGQEFDSEAALYSYGARYYDSIVGKFVSIDPVLSDQYLSDPQQQNRYAYVRGNPIHHVDPTGRKLELTSSGAALDETLKLLQNIVGEDALVTSYEEEERTYVSLQDVNPRSRNIAVPLLSKIIQAEDVAGFHWISTEAERTHIQDLGQVGILTLRPLRTRFCNQCVGGELILDATRLLDEKGFVHSRLDPERKIKISSMESAVVHELTHLYVNLNFRWPLDGIVSEALAVYVANDFGKRRGEEERPYYATPGDLDRLTRDQKRTIDSALRSLESF